MLEGLLDQIVRVLENLTSTVPDPEQGHAGRGARQDYDQGGRLAVGAGRRCVGAAAGPAGHADHHSGSRRVWHIQRQLVADIAACYGKTAEFSREAMIYCLFRHAAAQVVRDLAVRLGARLLLRRAVQTDGTLAAARRSWRVAARAGPRVSRWVPIAGAFGVGAYAFYDTTQVGRTAQALFEAT